MEIVRIQSKVQWKTTRAKGGNWVAICDPLALTIQSSTWANLMDDIAQTLNAMLIDLLRSNELKQFLRDRGWRPVGHLPTKPAAKLWFDVPFTTSDRDFQVALH